MYSSVAGCQGLRSFVYGYTPTTRQLDREERKPPTRANATRDGQGITLILQEANELVRGFRLVCPGRHLGGRLGYQRSGFPLVPHHKSQSADQRPDAGQSEDVAYADESS